MIYINLLPEELRQIERARKIKINITVLVALAVLIAVLIIGVGFYMIGKRMSRVSGMRARIAKLEPQRKEAEKTLARKQEIEKTLNMLDGLEAKRFLWSSRLNEISDCMPDELFLVGLHYLDQEPYLMIIKGEAPSGGGGEKVVEFIDKLRNTPSFIGAFPEISYFIETLPEGRQAFEIRCTRRR
jgi:hypothetical protein